MGSERSVRVAGPADLAELVTAVRGILGAPEGEFVDSSWHSTVLSVRPVAARPTDQGGSDYVVAFDSDRLEDEVARRLFDADSQARQVYYGLAASTGWGLCLLDHVGEPRVERPAVVPTVPTDPRPLDAGPRPLTSERSVRVAGPADLAELVAAVRGILGVPEGEFVDSSWFSTVVSVRPAAVRPAAVRPAAVGGSDYVVAFDSDRLEDEVARRLFDADVQARQVFYGLAASTGWGLCLLDHVGEPRVERPAIVPAVPTSS